MSDRNKPSPPCPVRTETVPPAVRRHTTERDIKVDRDMMALAEYLATLKSGFDARLDELVAKQGDTLERVRALDVDIALARQESEHRKNARLFAYFVAVLVAALAYNFRRELFAAVVGVLQ